MAQDACPICEVAQPTNWMITRLSPPATVLSCEEHIAINLITALAIQLDMPAELLYEIIETSVNGPVEVAEAEREVKRAQAVVDDQIYEDVIQPELDEEILAEAEQRLDAAKQRHANATARVERKPRARKTTQPRPEMDAEVTDSAVEAG